MASKYGFAQGLKELRFLFCQTSEHSAATRYETLIRYTTHTFGWRRIVSRLSNK
jgi:NADH dehydrogenase (ubiquinone) 1 alpha subcomplex subunit 2